MPFQRPRLPWKLPEGEMPLGGSTRVIGVLDLSPKAWRDKPDPEACLRRAEALVAEGADLIDVTALSEPPHFGKPLDSDAELRRLVPTLRKLRAQGPAPFLVTALTAETAARAIELGAAAIRDPSGLAIEPALAKVVNDSNAGLILGNGPGAPQEWGRSRPIVGLVETVGRELDSSIARARAAGVERRRVVVDPGFGIAKQGDQNWLLLERLRDFAKLGQPVMVSFGRQRFLVETVRAPESAWTMGAAVAAAYAVQHGAHFIRTAEPGLLRPAIETADRYLHALEES